MPAEWLGFAAACLTTFAFVPQVVRTWRTRETADLSIWWLAAMSLGIAAWLAYGLMVGDGPLIAANALTLVFVLSIGWVKMGNRWR